MNSSMYRFQTLKLLRLSYRTTRRRRRLDWTRLVQRHFVLGVRVTGEYTVDIDVVLVVEEAVIDVASRDLALDEGLQTKLTVCEVKCCNVTVCDVIGFCFVAGAEQNCLVRCGAVRSTEK